MRILALATSLDRPEAAIFAGLKKLGAEVTVVGTPAPEHRETLRNADIEVVDYEFKTRFDLKGMLLLRREIKKRKIQIVYALSNRALSSAVIGLVGVPVKLVTYRGTVGHISWFDPTSWFTYLNKRVAKILCVSKAVEDYLLEIGIPQERLITIYKGHRPEWYNQGAIPNRSDFNLPTDAFVVGCTAVMRAVKGVDDLINACAQLSSEIPNLYLLLIGSIKDPEIERAINDYPDRARIKLLGFRHDATNLARLADVTVMASKNREGFPKSVIEAMAQGVPAVVTAVGGMPELVGHGEAGLLANPCDPNSLAGCIKRLYQDPQLREQLGRVGAQRIATVFNVDRTIEQTYLVFAELVGAGNGQDFTTESSENAEKQP
jgi:glycosyltransferase involved in cell wall biosynthesis